MARREVVNPEVTSRESQLAAFDKRARWVTVGLQMFLGETVVER
jgi:hypothetical protein